MLGGDTRDPGVRRLDARVDRSAHGRERGRGAALGPLADNGGPTLTHLIDAAAHEAGEPAGCADASGVLFTTDQRGQPRPVGPCDVGAVERAP